MNRITFLFGVMIMMLISCASAPKYTHHRGPTPSKKVVKFETSSSMSTVLEKADNENKPIFVDFYTSWCGPCRIMDKEVFTNRNTADFLNRNFVNYKVNAEKGKGPDYALMYNVKSFPTLLFLDAKGNVILRHEGMADEQTMKRIGEIALAESHRESFGGR